MKKNIYFLYLTCAVLATSLFFSCSKMNVGESGEPNLKTDQSGKPPVAHAGKNQQIVWPQDSVLLDGSASAAGNSPIVQFRWTKISGPASFFLCVTGNESAKVSELAPGVYEFELTIVDAAGLVAEDTVEITVKGGS